MPLLGGRPPKNVQVYLKAHNRPTSILHTPKNGLWNWKIELRQYPKMRQKELMG